MDWLRTAGALLLAGLATGATGAAGQGLTLTPPPPGGVVLDQGGRQPFGSSGLDDPLRGLGRSVNPLDAPIQGDLDRYRDQPLPVPKGPATGVAPVRPPPRPGCAATVPSPGRAGQNWRCPVLR